MTANRDQPTDPKKQGLRPGPDTDPDATISGPLSRVDDPDATISGPLARLDDPDATISGPLAPREDPDATVTGPMAALMKLGDQDPEDTLKPQPRVDDPEDTFNGAFADFDPDATVSTPTVMRRRANPFAPKALPEALQANLAALGGLNPLIAYANPILSAVPQIRESLQHPAPELLMETLEDLVEAFEAGAANSGTPDAVVEASIYALCCMVDDAAAVTAWGRDWETTGLLQKLRGESNGGEQFFSLLADMSRNPEDNAELLELMYVCLALGFEGRFRGWTAVLRSWARSAPTCMRWSLNVVRFPQVGCLRAGEAPRRGPCRKRRRLCIRERPRRQACGALRREQWSRDWFCSSATRPSKNLHPLPCPRRPSRCRELRRPRSNCRRRCHR